MLKHVNICFSPMLFEKLKSLYGHDGFLYILTNAVT